MRNPQLGNIMPEYFTNPNSVARRLTGIAAAGALALGSHAVSTSTEKADAAQYPSANTPQLIADQASELVKTTLGAWENHQTNDGDFIDPVRGRAGGYGVGMLGQAMVELGASTNNLGLIGQGLKAELFEINHPNSGGFERFSLASAYVWNQRNLSANPDWLAAKGPINEFLRTQKDYKVGQGAVKCYSNINCYTNLKLVRSFAEVVQAEAGNLDSGSEAQSSNKSIKLNREVNRFIDQAVSNTGGDARFISSTERFSSAGILSDPSRNPLAYHNLSSMLLGRIVEELGPRYAPGALKAAFTRSAKAIVGFMAPDGDVAYIGRGQGQLWNLAASADALAIAAKNTSDPVWRGRFLQGASRTINRLRTVFTPGSWGMPLVPRLLAITNPNYLGIDGYANSVEYNGLALWALDDAVRRLRQTRGASEQPIASDINGVFLDPSHTRFASVRHGDRWWAVHASDTQDDARYDFGLVAAEKNVNGTWKPAIPYRPITEARASGGPVLIRKNRNLVPVSNSIKASSNGQVVVEGGWSPQTNGSASFDTKTKWIFKPLGDRGVRLQFNARRLRTYKFQVWYAKDSVVKSLPNGLDVTEPNGRHEKYIFNKRAVSKPGTLFHSAYDENLNSSVITVNSGAKAGPIFYDTIF